MADSIGVATANAQTARPFIESRVSERARRNTAEQVQETCSFARAERLLRREYYGRFLIELLQNAADAWRGCDGRSKVRVELAAGPALLVANQGAPFPATAVIESLGHIGRSTKAHGEAIGHKGIGFKSVLEVSVCPELYSGLQGAAPTLAVRFDPREALARIRAASEGWDTNLADVADIEDPLAAVPVLRYPAWVEALPDEVAALARDGFDTVVRLPFDDEVRPNPAMDAGKWLTVVRDAIADITDQMILLLGTFDRVEINDRLAGTCTVIEPRWAGEVALRGGVARERVEVVRNDALTSRWRLYRRSLPAAHDLAGEIAVGLRSEPDTGHLLPAVDDLPSSPFHLFFPTKIGSGLPFLLQGYFEVDAARTGFYGGSAAENDTILRALAELTAAAVDDTAAEDPSSLTTLADLLGAGGVPEEPRARRFRENALGRLDEVAWVPVESTESVPERVKPRRLLVDERRDTIDRIAATFPPQYIWERAKLAIPARSIGEAGHRYLVGRRPESADDLWDSLNVLLRPGPRGAWSAGEEDQRFKSLLSLVAAIQVQDPARSRELLENLRGDPESHLLPALAPNGGRSLLPLPDPREGAAGHRSQLVMARARDIGGPPVVPPAAMDIAFLPDGLLENEPEIDSAKPLGVRDFTVDNVLNRMAGLAAGDEDRPEILAFLWALLVRERRSDFSTSAAADRATEFSPSAWFWCRPGEGARSTTDAERQRRRRLLTETRVPARDGAWRPAGELAFGGDWARWLDEGACGATAAIRDRIAAYDALETVAPGDHALVATPNMIIDLLGDDPFGRRDDADPAQRNRERHAFLLSLGVAEVIPVEAFESRETSNREKLPWAGPQAELRAQRIEAAGGWEFRNHPWSGSGHENVWIAEDFRFRWSLPGAAERDALRTAQLLSAGAQLYSRLGRAAAFCPGCNSGTWHSKRYSSSPEDNYPSVLALELQTEAWLPAVLNGEPLEAPQPATEVWWTEKPPSGAGLRQSPLRYLALSDPRVQLEPALRSLARVTRLEAADLEQISRLLEGLRVKFDSAALVVAPESSSSPKQAFIGLHRLAYERLQELCAGRPEDAEALLTRVGVVCEIGDALEFVSPPSATRHDDGRFAAYRRYFAGRVPFAAFARDRPQVAAGLGIPPFVVSLERRPTTNSRDVTDEVSELVAERVPELLAIVVHHSLGAQTLEPTSQQFEERSRRLRNLRVHQVDDLVIDASVEGADVAATIGEGSDQDVFLEGATTVQPALYHDLVGEGWKEALRRKLHPHLAAVLENSAYAATFKNLLLADSDAEREEVLHELGISPDDVNTIRSALGAVSEEERARQQRWYTAIVATLRSSDVEPVDPEHVIDALTAAGLPLETAHRVVDAGGGLAARADVAPDGVLELLERVGVPLQELDQRLRARDPYDGLSVDVAQRRLSAWLRRHRQKVVAILSRTRAPEEAKALPETWRAAADLRLVLDPAPEQWLAPVTASLRADGLRPDAAALASDAVAELVRLGELDGGAELEALARSVYDREEQARILRGAAVAWRTELVLLGVLVRTTTGQPRAAIRAQADAVEHILPVGPSLLPGSASRWTTSSRYIPYSSRHSPRSSSTTSRRNLIVRRSLPWPPSEVWTPPTGNRSSVPYRDQSESSLDGCERTSLSSMRSRCARDCRRA